MNKINYKSASVVVYNKANLEAKYAYEWVTLSLLIDCYLMSSE